MYKIPVINVEIPHSLVVCFLDLFMRINSSKFTYHLKSITVCQMVKALNSKFQNVTPLLILGSVA